MWVIFQSGKTIRLPQRLNVHPPAFLCSLSCCAHYAQQRILGVLAWGSRPRGYPGPSLTAQQQTHSCQPPSPPHVVPTLARLGPREGSNTIHHARGGFPARRQAGWRGTFQSETRGFLALRGGGSLTACARGGSAPAEGQACGLLALREPEAAVAGVVPMACAASPAAQPSGARGAGASHPALASLSEEENSCLALEEVANCALGARPKILPN